MRETDGEGKVLGDRWLPRATRPLGGAEGTLARCPGDKEAEDLPTCLGTVGRTLLSGLRTVPEDAPGRGRGRGQREWPHAPHQPACEPTTCARHGLPIPGTEAL